MTKENWIKHLEAKHGLTRPSLGGNKESWLSAQQACIKDKCSDCQARRKTKKRSANARAREDAYRSCGLTKVIGSVSGSTYWE